MKIKLAFFGTPLLSAQFLEKLLNEKNLPLEIKLVVTQEDKPIGRKHILTPSPVKVIGQQYSIPVLDRLSKNTLLERLGRLPTSPSGEGTHWSERMGIEERLDLALVYFYGQIIKENTLKIPKHGFWNIHFSSLPKYRGPTPATFSLALGDKKTAVSFVKMDEELDHGPLIAQKEVEILAKERRIDLEKRLGNIAFEMLKELISTNFNQPAGRQSQFQPTPQDHTRATYTVFPTKNDGYIPFQIIKKAMEGNENETYIPTVLKRYFEKNNLKAFKQPIPEAIFNLFRAFYPWPGIWTKVIINGNEKRLKLTDVDLVNAKLILKKIQLEGKKEVDFVSFNNSYKMF